MGWAGVGVYRPHFSYLSGLLKPFSKTQIALEYAYRHKDISHVFWVNASSFLKFSKDYRRILQIARIPIRDGVDDEGLLVAVKRWLESPDSDDWILVLDNADNEEDFRG